MIIPIALLIPPASKVHKRDVWAFLGVMCFVAMLDLAQLGHARWEMTRSYDSLVSKNEREKGGIMVAIACLAETPTEIELNKQRTCVLESLRRSQTPSAMLPLALISQDMLEKNPKDLRLRIMTIFAITKTVHAHRQAHDLYQKKVDHAHLACNSSLIGVTILNCRKWFSVFKAAPNRIKSLLKIRYALSRTHVYEGRTLPPAVRL